MNDITAIARFWTERYAFTALGDSDDAPALVAVVGGAADATGTAVEFGPDALANLTWITGMLVYPCDAIYVSSCMTIIGMVRDPDDPAPTFDDAHLLGTASVMSWTHCLPSGETVVLCLQSGRGDTGQRRWRAFDLSEAPVNDELFAGIRAAVHEFDGNPIDIEEARMRAMARDEARRNSGNGYSVTFFEPSHVLTKARNWARARA